MTLNFCGIFTNLSFYNENIIKCIISICFVKSLSNSFLNNSDFKFMISDFKNLYIPNFTKIGRVFHFRPLFLCIFQE